MISNSLNVAAAIAMTLTGTAALAQSAAVEGKSTAQWSRVTLPFLPASDGSSMEVLTVPADKKRLFLRQTISDKYESHNQGGVFLRPTTGCELYANGNLVAPLLSVATDLMIPFVGGDAIAVKCTSNGWGTGRTVFVFSN